MSGSRTTSFCQPACLQANIPSYLQKMVGIKMMLHTFASGNSSGSDSSILQNDLSCQTMSESNWTFLIIGLVAGFFLSECWKFVLGIITNYCIRNKVKIVAGSGHNFKEFLKKDSSNPLSVSNNSIGNVLSEQETDLVERSLSLFMKHLRKDRSKSKVVEFLSPEKMLETLFSTNTEGSLSLSGRQKRKKNDRLIELLKCFQSIQKYSVDMSHPYFCNQLCGASDPIALAAELISLSVNTSAYTWETAPVFTMIEREVFKHLGQLVFENKIPEDTTICDAGGGPYDGLMLPGGSLSNLAALHVARYCSKNSLHTKTFKTEHDTNFDFSLPKEEKKEDVILSKPDKPDLVAFVSSEAHYSFVKAVSVTGIGAKNLVVVPTLPNGQMDVEKLDTLMSNLPKTKVPFFVAVTAGSTVRGSFDDIDAIVRICKKQEKMIAELDPDLTRKIWIHVDGAWGGTAIFSSRKDIQSLVKGLKHVDSFTFNPHKMLGAPIQTTAFVSRHKGILKAANSTGAKYLFDPRKIGAEYDLGDASFTCGRRTDAIKLWAQWKYYGTKGIGEIVDSKVSTLQQLSDRIRMSHNFMLACKPWPFNVNFFYLPQRIRSKLIKCGIDLNGDNPVIPTDISEDLATVSVQLKHRLHRSGEILIPFQPLSNQEADCFRFVLAGNKTFTENDIEQVLFLMNKYGQDL
mmetsp:Transcript_7620/g.11640  ORF Transcript_7620/g.11640 Transcript_7620/m.11640 type:complete len:686 (+) Transcript_7620:382-2439(+)